MKQISSKVSKTLIPGSVITCADNTGARTLRIISKIGKGGAHRKLNSAGVGDIIMASVRSGSPQYMKKKVRAVVIRQKHPLRRRDGLRVRFEDNAAILITDNNLAVGTEVKGVMAREVIERYIKLAGVATRVV
jgi:large subunit ribosomal protein L14